MPMNSIPRAFGLQDFDLFTLSILVTRKAGTLGKGLLGLEPGFSV